MEGNLPLKGLFILMLGVTLAFLIASPGSALKAPGNSGSQRVGPLSKDMRELLILTNADRNQAKLNPLKLNDNLIRSAQAKCNDMVARNYWGHVTPEGRSLDIFLAKAGIKNYSKAAENIAIGQKSPQEVNSDWMNSLPHRTAILDGGYTDVGFAQCTYDSQQPGLPPLNIYVEHFLAEEQH